MFHLPIMESHEDAWSAACAPYSFGNGPIDSYWRDIAIAADEYVSREDDGSCTRVTVTEADRVALAILEVCERTRSHVFCGETTFEDGAPDFESWRNITTAHVYVSSSGVAHVSAFEASQTEEEETQWQGWQEWQAIYEEEDGS